MDIDPTAIDSWPAALVAVVLILAVLVVPTLVGNRQVKAVKTTLTENNGGGSVKDSLDRIESKVDGLADRVTVLEDAQSEPRGFFGRAR